MGQSDFCSGKADAEEVSKVIRNCDRLHKYCLDPHTACGVVAVEKLRSTIRWAWWSKHQMVVLGTAHPAKFGDAVNAAMGRPPDMPPALQAVEKAPTRFEKSDNSQLQVRKIV